MTRDLPFDDDAARAEGTDTAYRVANGVARVARAGAYVTGGALVAANGTGPDTTPGTSNADSRVAGWSSQYHSDPSPDAPSPVVTFPDLSDVPAPHQAPHAPFAPHAPAPADVTMVARATESEWRPQIPGSDDERELRIPGSDSSHSTGYGIPGYAQTPAGPGLGLGGADTDNPFGLPETPAFGLPGQGIGLPGFDGLPGHGLGIPGYDGIGLPGSPGGLPGASTPGAGQPGDGLFDGIGDMFDGFAAMVNTEWQIDAHAGLDGVWFTSQMKVTAQVGQVGDQLDDYGKWLGDGIKVPGDTTAGGTGGSLTSPTGPSLPGSSSSGVGLPGTTGPTAAAPAPAPAPAAPLAQTPAPAPVAPAPIAPAPAPVAPAAPAPVATNPVVSTPLQTTIQPDAASTPIANVFGGAGAATSPLTAPAAAVPALFAPTTPTKPVVVPDVTGGHTPTTVPVTVPSKQPTVDIDTPTTVKLPDLPKPTAQLPEPTKAPVTVPPTGATGPTKPTVPDDDVVITKPGTTGGATVPSTAPSTPTVDVPDPTGSHPTATVPTQQPTAPTHQPTMPTKQPTVDIDPPTVVTPPPVVTVQPTQVPVKPPVIDTKPIAADISYTDDGYHGVSAGLFDSGVGGADHLAAAFPVEHHGYDFVV
ncbi:MULTISPECIES: hypothetical protein [unclassified Nocardia]|uniref:hypothetical protein n=1 Tax=unclassified Nocardia TaxID=2637762 RepID=UPI0033B49917